MKSCAITKSDLWTRIAFAFLFTAAGFVIIAVFSPYRPMLPKGMDLIGRMVLSGLLITAALLAKRSERFKGYWKALFGLFVLALAVSLDWIISCYLLDSMGWDVKTPFGIAIQKLTECIVVITVIIACTRVSGDKLDAIYLIRGKYKKSILIGAIAFCVIAAGAIPAASMLFGARELTLSKVVPWIPWILIFIAANATMEELMFRGLFLRKLEPLYGKWLSIVLIALVFTGLHLGVTYPKDQLVFLAFLVPLAFVWGLITRKTESIWGSVMFHAGMDIPVILSIYANLS